MGAVLKAQVGSLGSFALPRLVVVVFVLALRDSPPHVSIEKQGKYEEAAPLYRETVDVLKHSNHPALAMVLDNLAELLLVQGKYDEADPVYRESLDVRRKALPEGHPDIAKSLNGLAVLLWTQVRVLWLFYSVFRVAKSQ